MHLYEKKLSTEKIYEGKILNIKRDTVQLENGETALREVIMHPGGVCVAALDDENNLLFVKQYRYPYEAALLELPAGKLNYGEDPFTCGKRELMEETGATAEVYEYLCKNYPTPAYNTECVTVYRAEKLSFAQQNLDSDEFLDVIRIPLDKAFEMVMNDEIRDSKTQIGVLKLWMLKNKT